MTMTLYGSRAKRIAIWLGVFGGVGLLICMGCILYDRTHADSFVNCAGKFPTRNASEPAKSGDDEAGVLRIVDFWPQPVGVSDGICIVVAGVAKKTADAEADAKRARVEIPLLLNNVPVPLAYKPTAKASSEPQTLMYEFSRSDSAKSGSSTFWRDLLAGRAREGTPKFGVSISRAGDNTSGPSATRAIEITVYSIPILLSGAAATVLLTAAFVIFAANSTVLRDSTITRLSVATAAAADAKPALAEDPANADLKQKSDDATAAAAAAANLAQVSTNPSARSVSGEPRWRCGSA
ncbi:hypothetical protein [Afipia sp. GAS231]|uniref:hypothetical protein n=1 Tax=Afipia sp. GAS231 TaxID=1882747 RepID=UPI00087A6B7A|nr:hypothetical protein [Afipia sp. GAS231]SDO60133.1 hypothetical protein SAMN05444050_4540 [Afipia sp. GAS231]